MTARLPHCIQRAAERYGLDLTLKDVSDVALEIQAGNSLLIRRDNENAEIHIVRVKGVATRVVFNPNSSRIITFLPVEARKFSDLKKVRRGIRTRRREAGECQN